MGEASSVTGRKRDRTRSRPALGGIAARRDSFIERLAEVRVACRQLGGRPYRTALGELAAALQQIFSARLVIIRDGGEQLGHAPVDVDLRAWLDRLDSLHRHDSDSGPRCVIVPSDEGWPRASGIGQFVVVPLDQPRGPGSLWLGFAGQAVPTEHDLTAFALVGAVVSLALWRLWFAATLDGANKNSTGLDLTTGEIISIAAHELRTPLTPITMLLQSLERKARAGTNDVDSIVRTRRQVNRLARMVTDLLDLTRLREGRLVPTPALVEVGPSLAEVSSHFVEIDPKRRVELELTSEPLAILTDEHLFLQAMSNLLEHVSRLTPTDSVIRIGLQRRDNRAAIRMVADRSAPRIDSPLLAQHGTSQAQPLTLGVLAAQAVVMRFGGTLLTAGPSEGTVGIEATFPLSASDKG